MGRRTWLCVAQMFVLLCILVWLDEILDLPHLLLGTPPTPINWREALIETVLITAVGLFTVSRLIHDIAERKRAYEEMRHKTEDLALINSLNIAVNRGDSLQEIVRLLSKETKKIVSSDGVTVYLVSEDKDYMVMHNLVLPPAMVGRIERLIGIKIPTIKLPLKAGSLYLETLQTGKPLLINDPATIQRLTAEFTETVSLPGRLRKTIRKLISRILKVLDIQSVIIIPFVSEGEAIGLLDISSTEPLTESDLHRLETISGQLTAIIKRKRAEEALRESEARYRAVVEDQTELICRFRPDGTLTFVNAAYCRYFGKEREELIGHSCMPLIPEEDRESVRKQSASLSPENPIATYEHRVVTPDREIRWQQWTDRAIFDEQSRLMEYQAVGHDITGRVRAEEALRASEEYARNIVDSSLDMVITVDMERRIVKFNEAAQAALGYQPEEVLGTHVDILYADPQEAFAVHNTTVETGQCVREILNQRKNGHVFPSLVSASLLRDAQGELIGVMGISRDITERKQAEKMLRRRNRELALLNQASQALTTTLNIDQVLVTILEEIRHLIDVTACSVWLIDQETNELVCQQVIGPQKELVCGWRLAPGQGLAGWVAHTGESLIVPDAWADKRYFKDVDQQTGLPLRSILTVPLRVKNGVIGILQVVDTEIDHFQTTDLRLMESLAMTAGIAIENAQLYEQARRDAETRSLLLDEINHRVKNNLSAIIGLLYTGQRYARAEAQAVCQSIVNDMVNRVQSLATVHTLLSASEWAPPLLSELTSQVIRSALHMLPHDKHVSVDVTPSSIRVTPNQAHNLTLVINELATNTVKHGLRGHDTAHIAVRIALDDDTVLFEFRDDGPGYSEEVLQLTRYSVGFDLVQNIVRKSLHGELLLRNDHGAVAVIRFKAEV